MFQHEDRLSIAFRSHTEQRIFQEQVDRGLPDLEPQPDRRIAVAAVKFQQLAKDVGDSLMDRIGEDGNEDRGHCNGEKRHGFGPHFSLVARQQPVRRQYWRGDPAAPGARFERKVDPGKQSGQADQQRARRVPLLQVDAEKR
ncbi:hypothetical protein D3C83_13230 [compost metagenome]